MNKPRAVTPADIVSRVAWVPVLGFYITRGNNTFNELKKGLNEIINIDVWIVMNFGGSEQFMEIAVLDRQ